MTDNEKLDLILSELTGIKSEIKDMKSETKGMKSEMKDMKSEMKDMKSEMKDMKSEMNDMNRRIANIEYHIENVTDKNIQLIAENFVDLTRKLNQAIPVADKNLAYEVKVNYLIEEMEKLKKEVNHLKTKIA